MPSVDKVLPCCEGSRLVNSDSSADKCHSQDIYGLIHLQCVDNIM